ncbi:MAG: type II toxin-antitoxin system VapC family toxin [Xenococcaceae cyanobacterium]
MSGWLLDTNVLSEQAKPKPSGQVQAFLAGLQGDVYLSAITLHELDYGLAGLPEGKRKAALTAWLGNIEEKFSDCIIPVNRAVACEAAQLRQAAQSRGRTIHLADALIAGTASAYGLTLVTRNIGDFSCTGLPIVDPWAEEDKE